MSIFSRINIAFLFVLIITLILSFCYSYWWIILIATISFYFAIVIYGVFNIRSGFFTKSLYKVKTDKNIVSLTFDDGPCENTLQLLDVLKKHNVKASFFLIGEKIEKKPHIVKRIIDEGHSIGNHSYSHKNCFPFLSVKKMFNDLHKTSSIINKYCADNIYFRPPFGVLNLNIVKAASKAGLIIVGWSIRSYDTTGRKKEKILDKLKKKISGGDIILFHDTIKKTNFIVDELCVYLKKNNFIAVKINELSDI